MLIIFGDRANCLSSKNFVVKLDRKIHARSLRFMYIKLSANVEVIKNKFFIVQAARRRVRAVKFLCLYPLERTRSDKWTRRDDCAYRRKLIAILWPIRCKFCRKETFKRLFTRDRYAIVGFYRVIYRMSASISRYRVNETSRSLNSE